MSNHSARIHRLVNHTRVLLFSLLLTSTSFASDYLEHQLQHQQLVINTTEGAVTIKALHQQAFEVFYQSQDKTQLPSFAIDQRAQEIYQANNEKVTLTFTQSAEQLSLSTGQLIAVIDKKPFRISYQKPNGELIASEERGFFIDQDKRGFRFNLQTQEKILGGGQRVLGMDRRGHKMPLYNRAHYGYQTESNQMYYGLPAIMSSNKYMVVFDNSASGELDIGHSEQTVLQFSASGGRSSYLLIAASSYPKLIDNFVKVTGKQPLPPRWSLGSIASRFGYHSEREARAVVKKYQDEDFPLDAIVFDLYWFGPDVKGHMGNLTWDKKAFPTPVEMIRDFNEQGVKTIIITEPFILSSSKQFSSAVEHHALAKNDLGEVKTFDFYFGNTGLVDIFNERAQDWFWQFYQQLAEQGVAGWWGDLGEPEVHPSDIVHDLNGLTASGDDIHNVYGHQWAEMLYQRLTALQPDKRAFILMRSGFIGSQRYGMVPWTGDVSRSWGGFKPQVELALQMSLFGLSYTHSDLGGFAGDGELDSELYLRWLQYGVFQPVYRPHAQDSIAPEPVFRDTASKDILREYVKLRYQLMPYIYSLSIENSLTGMPMMRPMFFEDENNLSLIDEKDSYFYGDALLVTPVTEQGARQVTVNLPAGKWFNFWNDKIYQGGEEVKIAAPLNQTPVLVRAGAFIPMVEPVSSTKDYNTEALTLHYYADPSVKSSSALMYDDDGKDPNSIENDAFERLNFAAKHNDDKLTLDFTRQGHYLTMPVTRALTLIVHQWQAGQSLIVINGKTVPLVTSQAKFTNSNNIAWFDQSKQQLQIKFNWQDALTLSVQALK